MIFTAALLRFKPLFIAGLFGLLLLGIGCKKSTPNTPAKNSTTGTEEFVELSAEQQAYVYCTIQGNSIKIQLGSEDKQRNIICEFPDGSVCDALSYLSETCAPGENYPTVTDELAFGPHDDSIYGARYCDPIAEPVCGNDGRTYTNECIANLLGISVTTEGSCAASDLPTNSGGLASENAGNSEDPNSSPTVTPTKTNSSASKPGWVNIPGTLASRSNGTLNACAVRGTTYYLLEADCPGCTPILYTAEGKVACYPEHDIGNTCPNEFLGGIPSSCHAI